MSESGQLFFHANLMVFPGLNIAEFSFMRYYFEIGKRRNEFIISFVIANVYFTFLLLQVSITRNIRDFNGEKQL